MFGLMLLIFVSIVQLCFIATSESPCETFPMPEDPFPSPRGECYAYYVCVREDGLPDQKYQECDNGNHFSADLKKCVHPDEALFLPELKDLRCLTMSDRLSHPTNCSRYFECSTTLRPTVKDCPDDLHFSSDLKMCVSKREAFCGLYCDELDNPDRPTLLPDPTNCGTFFKCHNGQPFPMLCPVKLYFSVEKSRCEHPFNVNCINGVRTKSKNFHFEN